MRDFSHSIRDWDSLLSSGYVRSVDNFVFIASEIEININTYSQYRTKNIFFTKNRNFHISYTYNLNFLQWNLTLKKVKIQPPLKIFNFLKKKSANFFTLFRVNLRSKKKRDFTARNLECTYSMIFLKIHLTVPWNRW